VKDTLTNEFYQSYDLIHRTLVFFQESTQRLDILKRSQIFHATSKEGKEKFFSLRRRKINLREKKLII